MSDFYDISVRSQVLLEMLKTDSHKKFLAFLADMEKSIVDTLYDADDITSRARLAELLTDLKEQESVILDDWQKGFLSELNAVAIEYADLEADAIKTVVTGYSSVLPTSAKIISAYKNTPLAIKDYNGNLMLESFVKDFSKTAIKKINNTVTAGYYNGQTLQEIARAVKGTTAANFRDGTIAQIKRLNETIVRTSYQHVAQAARDEVHKANADIAPKVKWVSVLDSKTSSQCRNLDGRIFKTGEAPRRPLHPRCRSSLVPILRDDIDDDLPSKRPSRNYDEDGKQIKGAAVSESTTYYSWLKKQPAKFQDEVIGAKRAKLLRNGGISSEEFAKLSLDKNYKQISLEKMKKLRPDIFERANV